MCTGSAVLLLEAEEEESSSSSTTSSCASASPKKKTMKEKSSAEIIAAAAAAVGSDDEDDDDDGDRQQGNKNSNKCTCCARLPFRMRHFSPTMIDSYNGMCLFDGFYFGMEDPVARREEENRDNRRRRNNDEKDDNDNRNNDNHSYGRRRRRGGHTSSVGTETAERTASCAKRCTEELRTELVHLGLIGGGDNCDNDNRDRTDSDNGEHPQQQRQQQLQEPSRRRQQDRHHHHSLRRHHEHHQHHPQYNYTGASSEARMIAPFSKSELVLGPKLGSGGFASVYEVDSFRLDPDVSRKVHKCEQQARLYLRDRAQRSQEEQEEEYMYGYGYNCDSTGNNNNRKKKKKKKMDYWTQLSLPTSRYAVKHLKKSLVGDEEKFEKAAIDLALEAQLLLALDHPHIISVRGWSDEGPDAFRAGKPDDFFLVMDCLHETLDDRFFTWRHGLRKYRSRAGIMWNRRKFGLKIRNLFTERLQVAHDIASALSYMHGRRIVYRDLKGTNIGFDSCGSVQIYDFGLARLLPPEKRRLQDGYRMSRVGTRSTMAPEVRNKQPYDVSADVYSYGIVLWEILSLSTSSEYFRRLERDGFIDADGDFVGQKKKKAKDGTSGGEKIVYEPGARLPLPICPCWPAALQELVRKCLSYDPSCRPPMSDVQAALQRQMAEFGMVPADGHKTRRRSTFRLDLTGVDLTKGASKSKRSLATTVDFGSFSDHPSS